MIVFKLKDRKMFMVVCENESEILFLIMRVVVGSVCDWVFYEGVVM